MNPISKNNVVISRLCGIFADILEYPTPAVYEQVRVCSAELSSINKKAQQQLTGFLAFANESALSDIEELYTRTFDLQSVCAPYAGCHLFGDDAIRGIFMVKLREVYCRHNFAVDKELPDHISVILRFLSFSKMTEEPQEIIEYCLVPSLSKMINCFNESNPYKTILEALLITMESELKGRSHTPELPPERR